MLARADVDEIRAPSRYRPIERVEHGQGGVDGRRAMPLAGSDQRVAPADVVVLDPAEVHGDPVPGTDAVDVDVESLEVPDPHGA